MNEQAKRMLSKQRLEITYYEADVPYSQGTKQLDRVQAVNLSLPEGDPLTDKALRMTIFNQDLKTFVRGKKTIVADVEERDRPDTDYGPDRTIVQVYDDQGEPVSRKKGGGGGGGYRRSLEEDMALEAFKRVSIEGQTSVAQVGALVLAVAQGAKLEGVGLDVEAFKRLEGKYWKAIEKGLDNYLAAPKPAAAPAPATRQAAQDKRQAAPKTDQVSSDQATGAAAFKNFGEVLTRASKLKPPVTRGELLGALGLKEGQAPPDLNAAWSKAEELSLAKHEAAGQESPPAGSSEEAWANMGRK